MTAAAAAAQDPAVAQVLHDLAAGRIHLGCPIPGTSDRPWTPADCARLDAALHTSLAPPPDEAAPPPTGER